MYFYYYYYVSLILAHTNPVMLSFISLLYYKNLNDHVTMFVKAKRKENSISEYFGVLGAPNANPNYVKESEKFGRRIYKKKIVNKWHLLVFLIKNPILILDRKNNLIKLDCRHKESVLVGEYNYRVNCELKEFSKEIRELIEV
jgi:hypothetical protein